MRFSICIYLATNSCNFPMDILLYLHQILSVRPTSWFSVLNVVFNYSYYQVVLTKYFPCLILHQICFKSFVFAVALHRTSTISTYEILIIILYHHISISPKTQSPHIMHIHMFGRSSPYHQGTFTKSKILFTVEDSMLGELFWLTPFYFCHLRL